MYEPLPGSPAFLQGSHASLKSLSETRAALRFSLHAALRSLADAQGLVLLFSQVSGPGRQACPVKGGLTHAQGWPCLHGLQQRQQFWVWHKGRDSIPVVRPLRSPDFTSQEKGALSHQALRADPGTCPSGRAGRVLVLCPMEHAGHVPP